MKISEIIKRVDKSKQFKEDVWIGEMAEELHLNVSHYEDQDRLVSYWLGNWHCTDTWVGYKVYFLDDEAVAISLQTARKSDEQFEWISREIYYKVRDFVLEYQDKDEYPIDIVDLSEDIGDSYHIHYNGQVFDYHKKIARYQGEEVLITELRKDKDGYGTDQEVKIQFKKNWSEAWVKVGELEFPYNLTEAE